MKPGYYFSIILSILCLFAVPAKADGDDKRVVLFYGNSLTAGLGVSPDDAFPGLIASRIDSANMPFRVINAGLSGETSAGGLRRILWVLGPQPVHVFVLELGANDGLRGISAEDTYNNLKSIIERVKEHTPEVRIIIAGMEVPPNMGDRYASEFRALFPTLRDEFDAELIPFLLADVGGIPELNQSDRIHPNEEGHKIIAETVWAELGSVLQQLTPNSVSRDVDE